MAGEALITCSEFLDLAAAVALDVADPEDVRRVDEHARVCRNCVAWLDEFRDTASALGAFVPPLEPPRELQDRLMVSVRREPRPFAVVRRLWPGRVPRLSPAWLVAAASLVVAGIALAWVAMLQVQLAALQSSALTASDRAARFDRVVSVLASDKLHVMPLQPVTQTLSSSGYVFLDPKSGTGMLMCHDLPPVEQGHAYQIWFVRGNDRVSAGMLWPDRSGDGYTMIQTPPDLQNFDSIGLTDEPGNGSAWPTSPGVLRTPLKESTQ